MTPADSYFSCKKHGTKLLQITETKAAASVLNWYVLLATLTWCLTTKIPLPTFGQGYVLYLYCEIQDPYIFPRGRNRIW